MQTVRTKAKCPKCGSKSLIISETTEASCEWTQIDGVIKDLNDGNKEYGGIVRVDGLCIKCGHCWTFRKVKQIYDLITEI